MANTEINRASDSTKIVLDQNVSIERSLYLPYFESGTDPDVGNNDPNKMGAVAAVTESGITYVEVYQGGNEWKRIPYASKSYGELKFTQSDLTNVSDGMGDLILPFTGGQIAIALISRSGITDGIPSGNIVNSLAGGQVNSYNSISAAAQYGIVYYVGDPIQEPLFQAKIIIQNNSSQNVVYHGGDAVGTLTPGNGINENAIIDFSFSVDVAEGQTVVYTIYNSDGSVYYTVPLVGPGTQNGLPMTADKSQEFTITNT